MTDTPVVIIGGGIGGLVTALSLHRLGIECVVVESVEEVLPLGVGINLLPHAVRELDALGLLERLESTSVAPVLLGYYSAHGQSIWSEPRGRAAGYAWPQLSIHRGTLQTTLWSEAEQRLGAGRLLTGHEVVEVSSDERGARVTIRRRSDGSTTEIQGAVAIAADGIHSAVRRQFLPDEGMPKWNGALLWRGALEHDPILDGRTMVWAGHPDQKFVAYPILDLPSGRQLVNFIAEFRTADRELLEREDWNRPGVLEDFAPRFADWQFDWLDIPALLHAAPGTFLFPMVDRDPIERWTRGLVTLLGDAAHPMYPIGSNGASQAILDARVLAGCLRDLGVTGAALHAYEEIRRPATGAIVLANRGLGPEVPMRLVHERAPDGFTDIDEVISREEIDEVTESYRRTAGFAVEALAAGTSLTDTDYSIER